MARNTYNPDLNAYLETIESEFAGIPADRIPVLRQISDYITFSLESSGSADLVFICTHNSRRSQFGQVWAAVAAGYYGKEGIRSYSGGTEATAFNPRAVEAVIRTGVVLEKTSRPGGNHHYQMKNGTDLSGNPMFSKKYDHSENPEKDFCAIMVCSDADEACPFIPGASQRISLPYEDPKSADGTEEEKLRYDERCREIARDVFYVIGHAG